MQGDKSSDQPGARTKMTVEEPMGALGNPSLSRAAFAVFRRSRLKAPEPPIRAELFSVERLEQHAESLAAAQAVASNPKRGIPLARRLNDNARVLAESYRAVVRASSARQPITPAAEWLRDNFHVVDEQIREIKGDLPPGYYRRLPKLAGGPLQGHSRILGVAWALVAHTDSAFDVQKLTHFVDAYQRVQPLTIGELWALAITLRITLVENLRRLAEAVVTELRASQLADLLADQILATASGAAEPASAISHRLDQAPWSTAFAVELVQRLRDHDPNNTPALRWLNDRLAAEQTTSEQIVRDEFQRRSAADVSVRNVITSMRLVSMINWAEFFESVSTVDVVLRSTSDFAAMDFSTRDRYRRAIEELARESGRDELDVTKQAVAAARSAKDRPAEKASAQGRESDPGYYLIAKGRRAFEKELGCRVPFRTRLFQLNSDLGVMSYVGMIAGVTSIILALTLIAVAEGGFAGWPLLVLAIVGLVPASDAAIALVNRAITRQVGGKVLPGLELRNGVTPDLRTIIVVPGLLASTSAIEKQVERLEDHHLSNSDDNFVFALISDWLDCATEHEDTDGSLLDQANAGIARLNARYGPVRNRARFFLLHRRRIWNEGEGKWIGWERKRGKLHELNRLLRGAVDTTFLSIDGHAPSLPSGIRYVVTLDADTRLPIGTAKRLVGKMAHPLNQPDFDPRAGVVVRGHGMLQPRVTPSLSIASEGSLFQRAFSGPNGLDPYALAVSDVYQDLFEEGSFCGKGIYEVDSVEAALDGQIPEDSVLSHDLLEGIFARAGLASDIEVVEEFPSRYAVAAARQHRWVRGDWQLLPWILGFRHKAHAGSPTTPLPLMGRWKLLDNLRRSLSAPAALLAMLIGWLLPITAAEIWTACILLTIALPPLLPALDGIVPHRAGISVRNHLRTLRGDFALGLLQSAFLVTFLAHQAWLMVDAVVRTLFRLFIRRRHLLEWMTAAQTTEESRFDPRGFAWQLTASLGSAGFVAILFHFLGLRSWPIAAPFVILWALSPLVARWASRPSLAGGHLPVAPTDALALRLVARRTWRFFEKFVTTADNMLPPDNFQEDPEPVIAHRTSPTNLGLYLLSIIAARDFGWLGTLGALERLEGTFATMAKLERFRGHFYNWYDTSDLRALEPKYVSSVDSGNLAGHLIALGNACLEIAAGPICDQNWISGLRDIIALLRSAARPRHEALQAPSAARASLDAAIDGFAACLQNAPSKPADVAKCLSHLTQMSDAVVACARAWSLECGDAAQEDIVIWAEALHASTRAHRQEIDGLMPWASLLTPERPFDDETTALLDMTPTLPALPAHCEAISRMLKNRPQSGAQADLAPLMEALEQSARTARSLSYRLATMADLARATFDGMEFGFLFDADRQLLSIGYRDGEGTLDPNFYDLLASEARLASFIAIAKGDLPAKHWFRLGRTVTPIDGSSGLISWSGSMFEYLMPSLVMRAPAGSLLNETNRLVVWRQRKYAEGLGVPWGMSESEYNVRDIERTYQYSSFGVPDLAYKRGLGESTVIAPYASGLAAMIDPTAAARNFERMAGIGGCGVYGWFEALDYTRSRLPEGAKVAVIRAYMSHHQGMTIVGIANALHDSRMRARFHAEPIVRAAELLLQERMPRDVAVARAPEEQASAAAQSGDFAPDSVRHYGSAHSRVPRTHLLSNGRYSTMITAAGSGYSRWHDVAITRWREDVTCDSWGAYVFLRDVGAGNTWSAGYQPSCVEPGSYEVTFSEDRAEIVRSDLAVTTTLEIMVSPEDDAEVRRVSITNHGTLPLDVELTSYVEIVLARQPDDVAHPAFASLFVETEFVPDLGAILATRRRRSASDPLVWAAHLAIVEGESSGDVQYETERARFLGRGQTIRSPAEIAEGWPLSNTVGAVLDPIFSLRRHVRIPHGATARVAFWTLAASSRESVLDLADKHRDPMAFERAKTLAWTQAQMQLHHLGVVSGEAHLFQRLANNVLYLDPSLRPPTDVLKRGAGKASMLWAQGISGDLPIVLVRIEEDGHCELVRQLLRAHEYWRLKQLAVDLVILNERAASYVQDLQGSLDALVRMNQSAPRITGNDPRGAVFVLRADLVSPEIRDQLNFCARAVLHGDRGSLADQIKRARDLRPVSALLARRLTPPAAASETPLAQPEMEFFNGLGGFTNDGCEYLTILEGNHHTPAPWLNVVANPSFGFQVSTDGSGFTWSVNSQQNQLTPWSNDPVCDRPGEAIYVRDEDTGEVWGPTALPIREKRTSYVARHGQGYSRFEHASHEISLELLQYVPVEDPIKISRMKIFNRSGRARHLSITAYVEWVLGQSRSTTAPFIITEIDPETGAIFARNPSSDQFGDRVAFADMNAQQTASTCDRTEFLGRDGAMDRPLALTSGAPLSNRAGAGLDPCGALQTHVTLNAASTTEIVFFLGQSATAAEARSLLEKYRKADLDAVFAKVTRQWDKILGVVQVKTPDRAMDILLNRWLPYQTLACRVWARTAFYQASGAYGFRDQLQDVMALCISRPDIARAHLLRAAARQFVEGDVQHWWLPESGRGVRTRVSDDLGWLAYAVAHYVEVTADMAILDEVIPFLEGPVLKEHERDAFFQPTIASTKASLFEHCALALDKSLETGTHGLPLMGTGDWNDGMDGIGKGGKGESVWLGWFLYTALKAFADLAEQQKNPRRTAAWRQHAASLKDSLEREAWDGDWYRRAYFDDGSPLGSVANDECRIDSIAQSWAVISGAAEAKRAARAMAALDKYLVRRDDQLLLLFTPPFNHPERDPGYIKGYPPGIRENGGQYTHGAIWAALAFVMQGDGDRAGELLSMLNPIRHADTPTAIHRYKVEPYVVCADLYSEPPHVGRGGWTWYTGSAGWMYRVALEGLLGFRLLGGILALDPCIPSSWPEFEITFCYRSARYEIAVKNPDGVCRGVRSIMLDGELMPETKRALVPLADDGATHRVLLVLG
jgi:cyclic beta-1,2-glucan synthetase